jgi:hypothetical protein
MKAPVFLNRAVSAPFGIKPAKTKTQERLLTVVRLSRLDMVAAWRGHIPLAPHPDEGPRRLGGHGRAICLFSLEEKSVRGSGAAFLDEENENL